MISFTKIISNSFDSTGRLLSKFLRMGKSDVQETLTAGPFGIDSRALKDMVAVHSTTSVSGESIVIGFLNKDLVSEVGENRLFSLKEDGTLSTYIHLKNDQTMEIGGNADFMVRYSELETAFNQLKSSHNSLVNAFNTHTHATAATGPPSTPTPVPSVIPAQTSSADITGAKIEEIKTL